MMSRMSVLASLEMGLKVCFITSRNEVVKRNGALVAVDVYNNATVPIEDSNVNQCFIKTSGAGDG